MAVLLQKQRVKTEFYIAIVSKLKSIEIWLAHCHQQRYALHYNREINALQKLTVQSKNTKCFKIIKYNFENENFEC